MMNMHSQGRVASEATGSERRFEPARSISAWHLLDVEAGGVGNDASGWDVLIAKLKESAPRQG